MMMLSEGVTSRVPKSWHVTHKLVPVPTPNPCRATALKDLACVSYRCTVTMIFRRFTRIKHSCNATMD